MILRNYHSLTAKIPSYLGDAHYHLRIVKGFCQSAIKKALGSIQEAGPQDTWCQLQSLQGPLMRAVGEATLAAHCFCENSCLFLQPELLMRAWSCGDDLMAGFITTHLVGKFQSQKLVLCKETKLTQWSLHCTYDGKQNEEVGLERDTQEEVPPSWWEESPNSSLALNCVLYRIA